MKIQWVVPCLALALAAGGGCSWHRKPPESPKGDVLHFVPAARDGAAVTVPVRVAGRGAVALQFDLQFDAAAVELDGGTTGPAALRAGKELTVRPVSRGVARVVIYGANLDILPEGDLGAVQFRAVAEAPGLRFLALRRASPDAAGRELPSTVRPGLITIGSGV